MVLKQVQASLPGSESLVLLRGILELVVEHLLESFRVFACDADRRFAEFGCKAFLRVWLPIIKQTDLRLNLFSSRHASIPMLVIQTPRRVFLFIDHWFLIQTL